MRTMAGMSDHSGSYPPYPSGLRLAGRRVVVVGGGHVAQRRIPGLLIAGARVVLVAPEASPAVEAMAESGEVEWRRRGFAPADLDGAWYVVAATADEAVNTEVGDEAEARQIFCVRSDDAPRASAWTPAVGRHDDLTVAVLANRQPRRSAAVRDELLEALRDGVVGRHAEAEAEGTPVVPEVVLVGGGPGDPALVTVAARRVLSAADVVVADRLAPRALLDELSPDVELVDVAKLPRGRAALQEEINRLLVDRARKGKRVVRFKGGDPFVFGRGYEEALACAEAGVPVRVIPGITSAIAVPASVGIPVTHRGVAHEFTVLSGHLAPDHADSLVDWPTVARLRGTLVLLMAVHHLGAIAAALIDGGRERSTPVAVVSEGTMPGERTLLSTLSEVGAEMLRTEVRPPAIVVVGGVVAVAHPERYPLAAESRT